MTPKTKVYLLPGTMCDERLWQYVTDILPQSFQCHMVDLPLEDSIDNIVLRLNDILPREPVNLVGFSLGGYIAAQYTLQYPDQVRRLMVLANSPAKLPTFEVKMREAALLAAKNAGYGGILRTKINQLLSPQHKNNEQIINVIKAMDDSGGKAKFISQVEATTSRQNLTGPLAALDKPIQFVFGDHDALVNKDLLLNLNAPQINTHIITNCGHMSPLEQPQQVAKHIATFF
mgnify:CR=1 FL=1